jgi:hypothetical protein
LFVHFCDSGSWVLGLELVEFLAGATFFAVEAAEGSVEEWHGVDAGVFVGRFGVG